MAEGITPELMFELIGREYVEKVLLTRAYNQLERERNQLREESQQLKEDAANNSKEG